MSLIIAGFPGVGKSSVAHPLRPDILDAETSVWPRGDGWEWKYVRHIAELHEKHKHRYIFTSTHEDVLRALDNYHISHLLVYPNAELFDEYMKRYQDRGDDDKFCQLMASNWAKWLYHLKQRKNFVHVELQAGQFLADVVPGIVT